MFDCEGRPQEGPQSHTALAQHYTASSSAASNQRSEWNRPAIHRTACASLTRTASSAHACSLTTAEPDCLHQVCSEPAHYRVSRKHCAHGRAREFGSYCLQHVCRPVPSSHCHRCLAPGVSVGAGASSWRVGAHRHASGMLVVGASARVDGAAAQDAARRAHTVSGSAFAHHACRQKPSASLWQEHPRLGLVLSVRGSAHSSQVGAQMRVLPRWRPCTRVRVHPSLHLTGTRCLHSTCMVFQMSTEARRTR